MSKYKGVIFDLDGTLLNTLVDLGNSVNSTLVKFNYPIHEIEDYKRKIGNGFYDLIKKSSPIGTEHAILNEMLKQFKEIYDNNFNIDTVPYEGVIRLLNELVESNIKIAINSNKGDKYCNELMKEKLKDIKFIACYGERFGVKKKPDPYAANKIVEIMNISKKDVLYVGDSKVDIQTARNAEIDCAAVCWGFSEKKDLKSYKPNYLVESVDELTDIIFNKEKAN